MDALVDFKAATHMAAEAWKAADAGTKAHYEALASNEKDAYEAALKVYRRHKEEQPSWGGAHPPERRGSHDAASVSDHTLFPFRMSFNQGIRLVCIFMSKSASSARACSKSWPSRPLGCNPAS